MAGRPISMFSMRWRGVPPGAPLTSWATWHQWPGLPADSLHRSCLFLPWTEKEVPLDNCQVLEKQLVLRRALNRGRRLEFQTSYVSPCKPSWLPRTHVPWSTLEWSGHPADLSHCPVRPWYQVWRSHDAVHLAVKAAHQPDPSLATPSDTPCWCTSYFESLFLLTTLWSISQRSSQSHVGLQVSLLYGDVILPLQTRTLHFRFQFFSTAVILGKTPLYRFSCLEHLPPMSSFFLMLCFHYESKVDAVIIVHWERLLSSYVLYWTWSDLSRTAKYTVQKPFPLSEADQLSSSSVQVVVEPCGPYWPPDLHSPPHILPRGPQGGLGNNLGEIWGSHNNTCKPIFKQSTLPLRKEISVCAGWGRGWIMWLIH